VALEKLRDPVDVILRHAAIDVDVLGAGYDPDPVLPIIGDNVQLHGLLGRDHRIVLSMNKKYRLRYSLHYLDRPHLAKVRAEENPACQYD